MMRPTRVGLLRATQVALDRFSLRNRLVASEVPFEIPVEELNIKMNRRYSRVLSGLKTSTLKWYPEVTVTLDMSDANEWLPKGVKSVMREKYPIYYNPRSDTFRVTSMQGANHDASLEQVIDNVLAILSYSHRMATRDGSKFIFNYAYYKWSIPLVFRFQESKWLDRKRTRTQRAQSQRNHFEEPFGKGAGFKLTGGYQPQESTGMYHHAETLSQFDYSPNVSYKMDPHFHNPASTTVDDTRIGGCSWL